MAQAITRLFDNHEDAAKAVRDLEAAGVPHSDISLMANNADGRHAMRDGKVGDGPDGDNDTAEGAAKGATTGGLIGGGAGLLAGLGMLAIPGVGPVVAAGWLVSTAVGAAAGALAGGATGGVLGALKDAGHSDEDAHVYAEGVRRGGTLVSVRAANDTDAAAAHRVLDGTGGIDAAARGAAYRQDGWQGFDPAASPYSAEQVNSERMRFAEPRSFAAGSDDLRTTSVSPGETPDQPTPRPMDPNLRGV